MKHATGSARYYIDLLLGRVCLCVCNKKCSFPSLYPQNNIKHAVLFQVPLLLTFLSCVITCSGAAAALTVAGMKVLRTVWTDTPHQYIILALTLLFFNFDYAHLSEGLPLNYFIAAILFSKVCSGFYLSATGLSPEK